MREPELSRGHNSRVGNSEEHAAYCLFGFAAPGRRLIAEDQRHGRLNFVCLKSHTTTNLDPDVGRV